jgi:hypothetical protein
MKRNTIIRWVGGSALAAALLTGGVATFAQTPTPSQTTPSQTTPSQTTPPSDRGFGRHGGKMGGGSIVAATASVTGLTEEAVRTELAAGKSAAQIAEANGKTADDVVNAVVASVKTRLDAEVAAGTLTQAQADERLAQAKTRATEQVNQTGLPAERGRGGKMDGGNIVAATASVTGLTEDAVRTELAAGKSAAQIAEANGKTADDVVNAMVASVKTDLDAKVADGTLTQAQADERLAQAKTHATEHVNQTGLPAERGRGGKMGGGNIVAATASVTGLTEEAVCTELAAGKSAAQIAEANGKTADDVVNAVVASVKTDLDAEVAAGTLTQAQADERLAQAKTRATEQVSQTGLPAERGQGGPRGRHR